MNSKNSNYETILENDSLKICSLLLNKFDKYNNFKNKIVKDAYLKSLIVIFLNGQPAKIHKKIFQSKKISKVTFYSLEEKILTLELTKYYNKNIKFTDKISLYYKIKNYFLIFCLFIISSFILKQNKNKNQSICFFKNSSTRLKFNIYLKNLNRKKIFFSYKLFEIIKFYFINLLSIKKLKTNCIYSECISINKHLIKKKIYYDLLSFYGPKSVFFFEGDSEDDNLISYLANLNNIKTVCFQSGGFSIDTPKACFYKMNMDFFLTWGNYYKNELQKINPKPLFINIGNPTIKEIKKNNKGTIVFLMQQKSNFVKESEIKDLKRLIHFIKNNTHKKIIIRKHPNDLSNTYNEKNIGLQNLSIHDPKSYSLNESLKNCDIALTIRSSAIIEAGRMGIIPLMLNNFKFRYEKNLEKLRYFNNLILIGNYSQIKNSLKKILKSKNQTTLKYKIKKNFKENIYLTDILAIKKISNFIKKYKI